MNLGKLSGCLRSALAAIEEAPHAEEMFLSPAEAMLLIPGNFPDEGARRRRFERLRSQLAGADRTIVGACEWVRVAAWRRACRAERRAVDAVRIAERD
jgi:hypothetical protein